MVSGKTFFWTSSIISCEIVALPASGARALAGFSTPWHTSVRFVKIQIQRCPSGILSSLVCDEVNGEIINLASGDAISIREIIEIIQSFTGSGKPEFGKIAYRNGENMALYGDITKAKRLLNWNPRVDIYEGLEKTVNYYKNKNIK